MHYIVVSFKITKPLIDYMRSVIDLVKEAHATLKLKTCAFITNRRNCLSHIIRIGKLEAVKKTSDAIQELEVPTTMTE